MKARIINAAVLVAFCGAVASCAEPAGPPAEGTNVSDAVAEAAPAQAALARPKPANTAPPASGAQRDSILGVYTSGVPGSYSLVNRFAMEVGHQPNVVMYFSAWGDTFQTGFADVAWQHGAVPFVELEPYTVSVQSIAAGQQDAYLRSYADAVRRFGHPVLISFGHEMNGSWYPWGYTHTSPQVFRRAWRHVVTVFDRAGASNVRWLWVINGLAAGESPIREWWPGANYVTWVAMDSYYIRPSQTFDSVFGPTIQALRTFTPKPELIAETGIGPAAGQASKIPDLFAGVRAQHLLGFVYYDKAQNNGIYHQDWQIDYDRPAIAAFRRCIERYLT